MNSKKGYRCYRKCYITWPCLRTHASTIMIVSKVFSKKMIQGSHFDTISKNTRVRNQHSHNVIMPFKQWKRWHQFWHKWPMKWRHGDSDSCYIRTVVGSDMQIFAVAVYTHDYFVNRLHSMIYSVLEPWLWSFPALPLFSGSPALAYPLHLRLVRSWICQNF